MLRLEDVHVNDSTLAVLAGAAAAIDSLPIRLIDATYARSQIALVVSPFEASVAAEMQEAGYLSVRAVRVEYQDAPLAHGARLGRNPSGQPASYVPHPDRPG